MSTASSLPHSIAFAALLASGCGADQSFVVSNVEEADIAAGEQEVSIAEFDRLDDSPTRLTVVLDGEPACRILTVELCEEDAGHTLTTRSTVDGKYGCSGSPSHVPDAIFATYVDTCAVYSEFRALGAEATIEVSEDEIHLVLRATMEGAGTTEGRFDVEVDVVADLTDAES